MSSKSSAWPAQRIEILNLFKFFCNSETENCRESFPINKMNSYSLVIDISSDEENAKTSTPLKTLPLNMIGSLRDSSIEVYRGSDAELVSTSESPETEPTPKKKRKTGRVTFNLTVADSDTDYYEEPDTPQRLPSPIKRTPVLKETEKIPVLGNERIPNAAKLNDSNEPSLEELEALYGLDLEDRNYLASLGRGRGRHATNINQPHLKENLRPNIIIRPPECCPEEMERLEKEASELDEEERKIRDMKAGRGRGPLQSRKNNGRPPPYQ